MNSDNPQPGLAMPQATLTRIADRLATRYVGVFSAQTVQRYVFESYTALYRTARVRTHLTALAEHFAADRLHALAQSTGVVVKDVPEVLFVCVHNSGRSQMAAALLAEHGRGRVHVRSAGSAPAGEISEPVRQAMAEIGLSLDTAYPKPLTDDVVAAADVVVSMGCGDACPLYPGTRYLDWTVADPDGADLDTARRIREDIDIRVRLLLTEIQHSLSPN